MGSSGAAIAIGAPAPAAFRFSSHFMQAQDAALIWVVPSLGWLSWLHWGKWGGVKHDA
jgi:hypothetical protein